MADPLLSSLCRICHTNPTKYTCPRCTQQTCSLPCSKRHKVWSSCSGIRDPTVYKPKSQLATPSGIDHDYNFLHSIEHRVERSEKEIVENRGLVEKIELENARNMEQMTRGNRGNKSSADNRQGNITKVLQEVGTTVLRAPKGMTRNVENATTWSRNQKCVNWQVEWIREVDSGGRILHKAIEKWPITDIYSAILGEEHKHKMTPLEKLGEKKRKAEALNERQAKRVKSDPTFFDLSAPTISQDPDSGAWNSTSDRSESPPDQDSTEQTRCLETLDPKYHFYLHRPKTQSSYPKVLVPLDPTQSLSKILQNRTVLEFPTIYVYETNQLPSTVILEKDYVAATGDNLMGNSAKVTDSEDSDGDTTSSSDSSSDDEDEDMEDGEVVA